MIVVVGALAVGMFLLGRWGSQHAPRLVSPMLDAPDRANQERVIRRGAVVMQVAGVAFLVVSLFLVMTAIWRS